MNGYQLIVLCFGVVAAAVSIGAVVAALRSPRLRYKPVWVVGSLIGFVGPGVTWDAPSNLLYIIGISLPVVQVTKLAATGHMIVKTEFPFIALVALFKALSSDGGVDR